MKCSNISIVHIKTICQILLLIYVSYKEAIKINNNHTLKMKYHTKEVCKHFDCFLATYN